MQKSRIPLHVLGYDGGSDRSPNRGDLLLQYGTPFSDDPLEREVRVWFMGVSEVVTGNRGVCLPIIQDTWLEPHTR